MSGREAAEPPYSLATRAHGFPTKTKALAREIPPATQATISGIETVFQRCGDIGIFPILSTLHTQTVFAKDEKLSETS